MDSLIGRNLDHYQVGEQLGEGGMATVYKAFDTRLDRYVALKVIRADLLKDPEFLARFGHEARILARLAHPNIVRVFTYGQHANIPYLVMEYISGGTLKQRSGAPFPITEAARLLAPIARALTYAHQQQVVHRDVKPANILLSADGQPMLSDFGIARMLERGPTPGLTGAGFGVGTPEYMAPEQWEGKAGPASDIYALGAVLYELVTGRPPYTADTPAAVLVKQVTEPVPRPRDLVPDLPELAEQALFTALAKDPANRYRTMDEFAAVIEQLSRPPTPAVVIPAPPVAPGTRRVWPWYLGGLALLVIAAVAIGMLRGEGSAPPLPTASAPSVGTMALPAAPSAVAQVPVDYSPKTAVPVSLPTLPVAAVATAVGTPMSISDLPVIAPATLATLSALMESAQGHNILENLRWSPDGAWLAATVKADQTVVGVALYDRATLQLQRTLSISANENTQIDFSSDSKLIACVATDGQISVFAVASGQVVKTLRVSDANAESAIFSPNGALLVGAAADGTVKVWRTSDWQAQRTLSARGSGGPWVQLAISADSRLLAVNGTPITLWDLTTGNEQPIEASLKAVLLRFTTDGRLLLLSVDTDRTYLVTRFNPRDGNTMVVARTSRYDGFDVTPDGAILVTSSGRVTIFWDTATGKQLYTSSAMNFAPGDTPISPDGRLLATTNGGQTITLWGSPPGAPAHPALPVVTDAVALFQPTVTALFTPRAGLEVIGPANVERLAPFTKLTPENRFSSHVSINNLNWSADGRRLGVVTRGQQLTANGIVDANGVQVYDAVSLQPICWANNSIIDGGTSNWAFSHDGALLATPRSASIVIWDVDGCRERYILSGANSNGVALAFSPDGTLLAASAADNSVHVWDLSRGQERYVLREHTDRVTSVVFTRDGTLLATASSDNTVRLWDLASGKRTRIITPSNVLSHVTGQIVVWPDGKSLATSGGLYDLATGRLKRPLENCCGIFSPDGRLMLLNTLVYDVASWTQLRQLSGSNGDPAFSPDGKLLTFISSNETIEIWGVMP